MRSEQGQESEAGPIRKGGGRWTEKPVLGGRGANIRGRFWGQAMIRVGMAGRVRRRRGLLVLMDPRTEGQGVTGSQGYEERHLGGP